MNDFLKGLIALPVALIVLGVLWVGGSMLMTIIGGIGLILLELLPFLLRCACLLAVIIGGIWALGKAVTFALKNIKRDV